MPTELGHPNLSPTVPPKLAHLAEPPRFSPISKGPNIGIGDASPAPRWLIRPAPPALEPGELDGGPEEKRPKLPPLGILRWVFDAGAAIERELDESVLYEYAYKYLQNAICDPVVRDQMRESILSGPHAEHVAYVEDPLPILPPPPKFKQVKNLEYLDIGAPESFAAPVNYLYMYPSYERPSLAARACGRQVHMIEKVDSSSSSEYSPISATSSKTPFGNSSSREEADEDGQYIRPGECKWIWVLVTILVLSMFLCLFLYAFGILQ